jgi:glycosyltransferase involved in cell wall biosynthesis
MHSQKKLLFIADVSINRVIGGAERVLFEQTTRLARKGHSVHLITRRLPEHRTAQETICGVHEVRCRFDAFRPARLATQTWPDVRCQIARLHGRVRLDAINVHQPITAWGAMQAAAERKIPMVYTCHSLSFEEYLSRHPAGEGAAPVLRWMHAEARRWIEGSVLKRCQRIVALSEYTVQKLRHAYGIRTDRVERIPGGVDLAKFHPAEDTAALRRRIGLPADAFVLLTVRNLEPRMGLEQLVKAMQTVANRVPRSLLVIGGEGPLQSELSALVERMLLAEHVRFAGFIPESELPGYYQLADLFVLPSRDLEGFGMVTLEAMACGLPVIGTPVGGTKEILGGFDPTYMLQGCSAEAIADGILMHYERVSGSGERAHEISRKCRRHVEARYSWDQNITALERLFDRSHPMA